jgi:hypothetical protein
VGVRWRPAALALGLALAGCGDRRVAREPVRELPAADGAPGDAASPGGATTGTLTVRVEWKDAPAAVRAAPGRTRCGELRPPLARVHTLHGVADVAVWLDAAEPAATTEVGLAVGACAITPEVQVAPQGATLRLTSVAERRLDVTVAWGEPGPALPDTVVARVALPVVGHAAALPLERAGAVAIMGGGGPDPAVVLVTPGGLAAVTDETGAATFAGVAPGVHQVSAWLRGAGGHPGRLVTGEFTVVAGAPAELTLSLAP